VKQQLSAAYRRLAGRRTRKPDATSTPPPDGAEVFAGLLEQAEAASRSERWDAATAAWTDVTRAPGGRTPRAYTQLARAQRRNGEVEAAEATVSEGLRHHPTNRRLHTEAARVAMTARAWPLAIERWHALLALPDAADPKAYAQLIRAYLREDDAAAAGSVARTAVVEFPDDRDLALQHARAMTASRDWAPAAEGWARVIERSETPSPQAYTELARALQRTGDLAGAARALEAGLADHPEDPDLRLRHARQAVAARDWPAAVERLSGLVENGDARPEVADELARAYRQLGEFERAEDVLEVALRRWPSHIGLAVRHAMLAASARDWSTAVARWERLLREHEGVASEHHRRLARAYVQVGDPEAADRVLRRALELHPGDTLLMGERVFLATEGSLWSEAEDRWREIEAATDGQPPPELYAEYARRAAGGFQFDLADRIITTARAHHPYEPVVHRQYVVNAIARERKQRAPDEWDWSEALARSHELLSDETLGRDTALRLQLATDLSDANGLDEAEVVLRGGLDLRPDDEEILHELAVISLARGRWDDAIDRLNAPWHRRGTLPPPAVRIRIARAHVASGDREAARRALDPLDGPDGDERDLHAEAARIASIDPHDPEQAVAGWAEVLRRFPDPPVSTYRQLAIAQRRAGDDEAARRTISRARERGLTLEANPGVVAIIGGGPSLRGVDLTPIRDHVHGVAVNATATALPWCDVAVTHDVSHLAERFHEFPGPVVAGVPPRYLETRGVLRRVSFRRRLVTDRLSEVDDLLHSGGHTSAHTALNYAYLLRPVRIVLFGVDLTGFWGPDEYWHRSMDDFNRRRFDRLESRPMFDQWHAFRARKLLDAPAVFASTVPQLQREGIEVINASPQSSLTCFPRVEPEEGVAACTRGSLSSG
jgi:tetratricopeptide (TPR) repeat protein